MHMHRYLDFEEADPWPLKLKGKETSFWAGRATEKSNNKWQLTHIRIHLSAVDTAEDNYSLDLHASKFEQTCRDSRKQTHSYATLGQTALYNVASFLLAAYHSSPPRYDWACCEAHRRSAR